MSRSNCSATTTSKAAPTPNFTAWPNPSAAGSPRTNSPADRASRFSPTTIPRWVAAYLGIIASGCAAVPLDTALHADQVTKLLKDSGTSAIFCDAKHVPRGASGSHGTEDRPGPHGPGPHDQRFRRRTLAGESARHLREPAPATSSPPPRTTTISLPCSTPPAPPPTPRA